MMGALLEDFQFEAQPSNPSSSLAGPAYWVARASGQDPKDWLPLANDADSTHTPTMSLKNAALLGLIGTVLLTVLIAVHFIFTLLGVMHDVIPAMALLTSMIHLFESLSVSMFLYVFYKHQS